MRAYSTTVVASALGVDRRWLDALIATDRLPGVPPERQGKSRAIPPKAVLTMAVAMELTEHFGTSLHRALDLAAALLHSGEHSPAAGLVVRLDVTAIERRIALRLNDAVDANPPVRRGRPPRDGR